MLVWGLHILSAFCLLCAVGFNACIHDVLVCCSYLSCPGYAIACILTAASCLLHYVLSMPSAMSIPPQTLVALQVAEEEIERGVALLGKAFAAASQ